MNPWLENDGVLLPCFGAQWREPRPESCAQRVRRAHYVFPKDLVGDLCNSHDRAVDCLPARPGNERFFPMCSWSMWSWRRWSVACLRRVTPLEHGVGLVYVPILSVGFILEGLHTSEEEKVPVPSKVLQAGERVTALRGKRRLS